MTTIPTTDTLAMICEQYIPHAWTNVYTDGSATNAIQDSGAGIVFYLPSGSTKSASAATQRNHGNYKTESEALIMAISRDVDSQQKSTMAVFLSDALSVLQALTNNTLSHLAKALQLLSNNYRVALQWIPAQCGASGNEQADTLAKQGVQTEQPVANVSYQEKAISTKALMMPSQEKDAYHLLSRPEQVIMVILRPGNNQWNARMYTNLKMVPSDACLFGEEEWQTMGHLLQNCKKGMTRKDLHLDQLRRYSTWNYLVTDNIVNPCYWSDRVTANEKKKMKKLCTVSIS